MPLCLPARVLELSEELLQRRRQEEKEAQDLESMVHSVEQNLHLMTVRQLSNPEHIRLWIGSTQSQQHSANTPVRGPYGTCVHFIRNSCTVCLSAGSQFVAELSVTAGRH